MTVVWGISLIIVLTVSLTGHAGREYTDDDRSGDEMQWCWVSGDSAEDQFVWEIIGGKFIEWTSCAFITVFYLLTARKIFRMRKRGFATGSMSQHRDGDGDGGDSYGVYKAPLILAAAGDAAMRAGREHDEHEDDGLSLASSGRSSLCFSSSQLTGDEEQSAIMTMTKSNTSTNTGVEGHHAIDAADHGHGDGDGAQRTVSSVSESTREDGQHHQHHHDHHGATTTTATAAAITSTADGRLDSFIYLMALVPLVFFSIRIWGSLRSILIYADRDSSAIPWLTYMQALFDPSQGFFNFLLFVASSPTERAATFEFILYVIAVVCGHRCADCCERVVPMSVFPSQFSALSTSLMHHRYEATRTADDDGDEEDEGGDRDGGGEDRDSSASFSSWAMDPESVSGSRPLIISSEDSHHHHADGGHSQQQQRQLQQQYRNQSRQNRQHHRERMHSNISETGSDAYVSSSLQESLLEAKMKASATSAAASLSSSSSPAPVSFL